jgi:hypothetical protein
MWLAEPARPEAHSPPRSRPLRRVFETTYFVGLRPAGMVEQ